jgi:hypothetical protein
MATRPPNGLVESARRRSNNLQPKVLAWKILLLLPVTVFVVFRTVRSLLKRTYKGGERYDRHA